MSNTSIVIDYTFRDVSEILDLIPTLTTMTPVEYGIFGGVILLTMVTILVITPLILAWMHRLGVKRAKLDKQKSVKNFLLLKELESEIEKELDAEAMRDMQKQ